MCNYSVPELAPQKALLVKGEECSQKQPFFVGVFFLSLSQFGQADQAMSIFLLLPSQECRPPGREGRQLSDGP